MKIVLDKAEFLDNLTPCMGTVSSKNTIASIEGILIETMGDNLIRISSYDMNKGVRITFPAIEIIEKGSCIINAQKLFQIVKLMPEDEICVEVDEKYNAFIKSGKSSFSLFSLKGTEFPSLPELSADKGFAIKSSILKKMIVKVINSVAEQDSRPMLCGAYFKINANKLEIVSCDSYTLAKCNVECDLHDIGEVSTQSSSFIIPGHALNELIKILPDKDDEVSFYLSRKHAIIKLGDLIFFTRMIDSEYIDYKRILPTSQTIFVKIDRERLLRGLERVNLVADEKIQGSARSYVKISIKDNTLSLTSSSVNGKVYDEMECEHDGENLEIGFNCRYLINSVRSSEGEKILLTFKSATQSVTIEPAEKKENESFFYMILPVRMNE
ncbi:MAG: DNA polymerase III subunit beta [Eubacteriales bacterium]|nr:DNA polymerase III subunit beta [Eubacteriales bacterium]